MGLTVTNALVAIAVGTGPPMNQSANAALATVAGSLLSFSLQSTMLVQRWEVSIVCDDPFLNGQRLSWNAGQANLLQMPAPAAPYRLTYQSLVSDGSSSTAVVGGAIIATAGITLQNNGTPIAGNPHAVLNATGSVTLTDNGNGIATLNGSGGGAGGITSPTLVTGGGTTTLSQALCNNVWLDVTGAQNTLKFPASPNAGDIVIAKLVGTAVAPVVLNGNGKNFENPDAAPGLYGSTGTITFSGQSVWWQYDGTEWGIINGFTPVLP